MDNQNFNHTRIRIPEDKRYKLVQLLNSLLADMADLISQSKFAHWNVRGPNFFSYHKLFEDVSQPLEDTEDELAERITTLGGVAKGTIRQAAHSSSLKEIAHDNSSEEFLLSELIENYAAFANKCRASIDSAEQMGDAVTADMLTELTAAADKSLWLLEAHHN